MINTTMQFDDLTEFTGEMGVYQGCVFALLVTLDLYALDATTMIFVGADMPHWCRIDELANLPFDQQKYIAIPYTTGPQNSEPTNGRC